MEKNKPEFKDPYNPDDDFYYVAIGAFIIFTFITTIIYIANDYKLPPNKDFFINNALLSSFIINSLICFNKGLNFKSLYSIFDIRFDNASLKPFFSFTYYLASIFYTRNLLLIILMFDSSTFFQSIIISTGAFIGLKLFLDTLVSIFKK